MAVRFVVGLCLIVTISFRPCSATVVIYDFENVGYQTPFDLGVSFEQIDSMTIHVSGTGTSHTWLIYDLSFGFVGTHVSETWDIKIWDPGHVDLATTEPFIGNGSFDENLSLWSPIGDWGELEPGIGEASIRPVLDIMMVATQYAVLDISDFPSISLAATLYVDGVLTPVPGDLNGDREVTTEDVVALVLALTNHPAYNLAYPDVLEEIAGDVDGSGTLDLGDLSAFAALLQPAGGAPQSVPEPNGLLMATLVSAGMLIAGRRRQR